MLQLANMIQNGEDTSKIVGTNTLFENIRNRLMAIKEDPLRPPLCYLNIFIRYLMEVLFVSNTYDTRRQDTMRAALKDIKATVEHITDENKMVTYMNLLFNLIKSIDMGTNQDFIITNQAKIDELRKDCFQGKFMNIIQSGNNLIKQIDEYCFLPTFPTKKDMPVNTGITTYAIYNQAGKNVSYGYLFCLYVIISRNYLMLESTKTKLKEFNCPVYNITFTALH